VVMAAVTDRKKNSLPMHEGCRQGISINNNLKITDKITSLIYYYCLRKKYCLKKN
jgi:hypothetical protein